MENKIDYEEVAKHSGYDQSTIVEKYDGLAEKYDKMMETFSHADPEKVAETVEGLGLDKDVKILDMGCGTGLGGVTLNSKGYSNIDGLDASAGMIEKCQEKGVYRNID